MHSRCHPSLSLSTTADCQTAVSCKPEAVGFEASIRSSIVPLTVSTAEMAQDPKQQDVKQHGSEHRRTAVFMENL